jgi:ankyrin repeat protein
MPSSENINSKLIEAAKQGHYNVVRTLLDKDDEVNRKDKDGKTALMWAAFGF